MSQAKSTPCGAWPSPLSPARAVAGAGTLATPGTMGDLLHWVEGRPAEKGRNVLVRLMPDGRVEDVLGPHANVCTRVHEYGGLSWAAIGDSLVYSQFDDQRLRVVHRSGTESILTPEGCRYADFDAAPDGASMVAVREDHRGGGEAVNTVVQLDIRHGDDEGTVLFGASDFVAWPRLSPDQRQLALVSWVHPHMPWDETRLMVADLDTGHGLGAPTWHCVAGGPGISVIEPQWGADGRLYFLSDESGWWNLYRWHGGRSEALTDERAEIGAPLWHLGQRSYLVLGDDQVLLRRTQGGVDALCLLDVTHRKMTCLDLPYVAFSALTPWGSGHAVVIASAADSRLSLVSIQLPEGNHRILRKSGDLPLPAHSLSPAQSIEFATRPGADGAPRCAHAWYYPPHLPGHAMPPGERPPLIVMLHGGPTSHAGPSFNVSVQFWTSRGFAVVDVNYGGSSGFGRAYRERLRGQWGVVDLQDAVAAVDHLAALGWVDGGRVAIRGGSAGGFTVLCGLAFTTRFAAGINYFGVSDLETLVSDSHKFESRYLDGLVAPRPEGLAVYRERNPLHHMGHSHGALLTLQGSEDKAVPPRHSREIVAAARAAGRPVAYIEFEGEGHGFRRAENLVRALQLELAFLGRVFGFQPADEVPPIDIENASALH
jgi:dipeptidyl aminopeptidase/acylaminoacyl peptidase